MWQRTETRWIACVSVGAAIACAARTDASSRIVLDGSFDDWIDVPAAIIDDLGDNDDIDIGLLRIAHNDAHVYLQVEFTDRINLQKLQGSLVFALDSDGDPQTGESLYGLTGADIELVFSPPIVKSGEQRGEGVSLNVFGQHNSVISPYQANVVFAPTYASRRFEIHLDRNAVLTDNARLFSADSFSLKAVAISAGGGLVDETESVSYSFSATTSSVATSATKATSVPSRPDRAIRLVSWNTRRGDVLRPDGPGSRILAALQPDIILLQELTELHDLSSVKALLDDVLPLSNTQQSWQVALGAARAPLRCAVASHFPLSLVDELNDVPLRIGSDDLLNQATRIVTIEGTDLLVSSLHLKCCGFAESPEDNAREAEVFGYRKALQKALRRKRPDAVLFGGDLNLVGLRRPLSALELAQYGAPLGYDIIETKRLDGASNVTWSDPSMAFVPGRLDYLLFDPTSLKVLQSFVFSTTDLNAQALMDAGLRSEDSALSSDHLPLVIDISFNLTASLPEEHTVHKDGTQ